MDLFETAGVELPNPIQRIWIYGPRDRRRLNQALRSGATVINTTSHSDDWGRQLSPFLLGPVRLYDRHVARCVENGWQYAKLYPPHADAEGNPTADYWRWATAGWTSPRPVRYPMGKGARPLCSLWNGEHLDYVSARKRIYVPLYQGCVVKTAAWRRLCAMLDAGESIHLWDFDGYDYFSEGIAITDALDDPHRKFGHSMVLALMLEERLARS